MRGLLFENMVIMEYVKRRYNEGNTPSVSYWRDANRNETDLIVEEGGRVKAIEIKASSTTNYHLFREMRTFTEAAGVRPEDTFVVYDGSETLETAKGSFCNWRQMTSVI
jgi:predicted AAA+ superfamily ATPase